LEDNLQVFVGKKQRKQVNLPSFAGSRHIFLDVYFL